MRRHVLALILAFGMVEVAFRVDAAFAKPEIYEALEARGVEYAIRIPVNASLEWEIAELLFRPPGRPSHKPLPIRAAKMEIPA